MQPAAVLKTTRQLKAGDRIRYIGETRRVLSVDSYAEPYAPGGVAIFVRTEDGATIPATWSSTFTIAA